MQWFTYILQCSDGSYYVGHTEDLEARLILHNAGTGASYTGRRRSVLLVYSESFHIRREAIQREKQLKRWSRAKKQALINGAPERLHSLAQRRRR